MNPFTLETVDSVVCLHDEFFKRRKEPGGEIDRTVGESTVSDNYGDTRRSMSKATRNLGTL